MPSTSHVLIKRSELHRTENLLSKHNEDSPQPANAGSRCCRKHRVGNGFGGNARQNRQPKTSVAPHQWPHILLVDAYHRPNSIPDGYHPPKYVPLPHRDFQSLPHAGRLALCNEQERSPTMVRLDNCWPDAPDIVDYG